MRVYQYNTATKKWTQLGADIDGEAKGDQAGRSVSLSADGTTLAIGATRNDRSAFDAGHVRVYKKEEAFAITSSSTPSVPENTTDLSYTAKANRNATFSLTGTDNDNAKFNINTSTGKVTFKKAPDYENPTDGNKDNLYNIQITAKAGTETVTKDVTIKVTNVVEAPLFSSTLKPAVNVPENTPITKVVYTASVSDASTKDAVSFSLEAPST